MITPVNAPKLRFWEVQFRYVDDEGLDPWGFVQFHGQAANVLDAIHAAIRRYEQSQWADKPAFVKSARLISEIDFKG